MFKRFLGRHSPYRSASDEVVIFKLNINDVFSKIFNSNPIELNAIL